MPNTKPDFSQFANKNKPQFTCAHVLILGLPIYINLPRFGWGTKHGNPRNWFWSLEANSIVNPTPQSPDARTANGHASGEDPIPEHFPRPFGKVSWGFPKWGLPRNRPKFNILNLGIPHFLVLKIPDPLLKTHQSGFVDLIVGEIHWIASASLGSSEHKDSHSTRQTQMVLCFPRELADRLLLETNLLLAARAGMLHESSYYLPQAGIFVRPIPHVCWWNQIYVGYQVSMIRKKQGHTFGTIRTFPNACNFRFFRCRKGQSLFSRWNSAKLRIPRRLAT